MNATEPRIAPDPREAAARLEHGHALARLGQWADAASRYREALGLAPDSVAAMLHLADALERNPPPAVSGRRIKIRYMTQPKARPPYFALFGNQLDALPKSYERYLINGLRDTFELPGVPIRISRRTGENPYDKEKKRKIY